MNPTVLEEIELVKENYLFFFIASIGDAYVAE